MKRHAMLGLAVAVGTSLAACGVASAAQETLIYGGEVKTAPAAISLGSWGSGSLKEVSEVRFKGASTLRLTSQGDFQGGVINFQPPLNVSGYAGQPNAYIEMWVRPYFGPPKPAAAEAQAGQARPGAAPTGVAGRTTTTSRLRIGGFGLGSRRSEERATTTTPGRTSTLGATRPTSPLAARTTTTPRSGGFSFNRRERQATTPSAPSFGRTTAPTARPGIYSRPGAYRVQPRRATEEKPKVEVPTGPAPAAEATFYTNAFRVQLTTDKGAAVLADYPIYPATRESDGWVKVAFPLSEFRGPIGDQLDRIAIFAERSDVIYIGEVKLALNTAALEASPAAYPGTAQAGEAVTFLANATAGDAPIEAVWDFDNSNGVQVEATGTRVVNVYNKPGDYEATVTIRDATGANAESRTYVLLVRVR